MLSDTATNSIIYAADNTQAIGHPFWSILGAYLDDSSTEVISCDDDDDSDACAAQPDCDLTLRFTTLEQLAAAKGSFPDSCNGYYALFVLGTMLDSALVDYAATNKGYDSLFKDYVTYVSYDMEHISL